MFVKLNKGACTYLSNLYERVKSLCDDKGVSPSRMCIDIGVQPSLMGDLKSGRKKGMNAVTADKVAKYFGVTVPYLLGTEDEKKPVVSDNEQELLDLFRAANPQMRSLVLAALKQGAPSQPSLGVGEADV